MECGVGIGVVAEWVPPEVGLVGRGVGGGGVGCLGQNQYCGHPSLATPSPHPSSYPPRRLSGQIHPAAHLRLRSKSEAEVEEAVEVEAELADGRLVWAGCRCRVITTLKTRVALARASPTPASTEPGIADAERLLMSVNAVLGCEDRSLLKV